MRRMPRAKKGRLALLGLTLAALGGCQTYIPETGQTLPAPNYLDHPAQYIPRSPQFPLQLEQAAMEAQAGVPVPLAGAIVPLPNPVPPGP